MNSQAQDPLNIYKIPVHKKANLTRQSTSQRKSNNSLPSINFTNPQKVNNIRRQIDEKKQQVSLLKARIHSLKYQKNRNENKKSKNEKQAQFLRTIKQRFRQDREYKNQIRQMKEQQLGYLKKQTTSIKQSMIYQRQLSKSIIRNKKSQDAKEQRLKRQYDEDHIQHMRNAELEEKRKRAKSIKDQQQEVEQKMKRFTHSKMQFAKKNHQKKVQKSVKEKKKIYKTLDKLKQQENLLMQDCKKSQLQMLTSLYELEQLNPQRKKRGFKSARTTSINSIQFH